MLKEATFHLPISELATRIRTRALSPVELTGGYLERIARFNARFNAYETVTPTLALEQARAAEREIAAGKYRGPLHGIPYGAKDLLDTAGVATAWGTKFLKARVPETDATVITRLREAGAVLLGKTAMVEFAGCLGYRFPASSAMGPGRNPWDASRWTGGSSSGSGAAMAAGLAAFAIGTETWGSILCPAAFCGVTGLRPTYGVVSRAGGMVGAYTFDKVGPLVRTAGDARLVMQAIVGPDPRDPSCTSEPLELRPRAGKALGQLKAAIIPLEWGAGTEPQAKAAFEAALGELRDAGLAMELATLPDYPASEVSGLLITVEALASFEPFLKDGRAKQLHDDMAWRQSEVASVITGADVMKAWRMRGELQRKTAEFFERYDVILSPNFQSVAPPVDRNLYETLPYGDPVGAIGNGCGLPAIALPCGAGAHGLPVGFQIMGAPFEEATLLDLGELYQSRTPHHRATPKLS